MQMTNKIFFLWTSLDIKIFFKKDLGQQDGSVGKSACHGS